MADKYLDCKNLKCPMPIVKISKAMQEISVGQTLFVEATDLAFKADIEAWTQKMGHKIVQFTDGPTKQAVIERCN